MSHMITSDAGNLHKETKRPLGKCRGAVSGNASFLLIAVMFIMGSAVAVCFRLPIKGKKRLCLVMFGGMIFLVSSFLNNITAVILILPVVFVLLRTLEVDKRYIYTFFATILALSNTGGAASPFPAIIIMTSGITTFLGYLTRAFPLFALTSAVLLFVWALRVKKEQNDGAMRRFAVASLKSQYKNVTIRIDVLKWLGFVFIGMLLAWSIVPQNVVSPEIIAVLGYVTAAVISSVKKVRVELIAMVIIL